MSEPLCATCGHPRDNHPYRHPFVGPSKDDTIKELEAKLAKAVEALLAVAQHEVSIFWGPDAEKNERASWRGVMRKVKAALAEIEGEKE
jgi:hypothetical protein